MKNRLRPTRHGKWSGNYQKSLERKMKLLRELFALVGTELNHGQTIPAVRFVKFYGNQRRFTLSNDSDEIFINQNFIKSRDLDYIILCALCFFYTEKHPELVLGGEVTLVDLHTCIDISESTTKEIFGIVLKNVSAVVLTNIIIRLILR